MQNIKASILALPPVILFLITVIVLGGAVTGGGYLFNYFNHSTKNTCTGTSCGKGAAPQPFGFNEPEKIPQIEDVCGDGICGVNEGLYPNVCPRDCGGVAIPPTIESFTATPNTIKAGKPVVLSWSSDAIFCAPGDEGSPWGGRWTGGEPKGSVSTDPLSSNQIYTIACMSNNGGMTTKSVAVSVIQPPPPVAKVVKKEAAISFTAKSTSVGFGETATLSWSSINANTCFASGDGASWGWSGIRPTFGMQVTPPLTSNQTYIIKCTGMDGTSSKKVTINVSSTATAPSLSFNALPTAIPYGEKATLAWIISDAESCTASNSGKYPEWTGPLPSKSLFGGLKSTRELTEDQTFTLTCTNGTGTATATTTKSVAIAVSAPSSCTLSPWGEIQSGSSIEAYLTSTVAYGETCTRETRNCLNGKLSGSYTNQSCKAAEAANCPLGDTTVKSGETITAYKTSLVKYGETCTSETRSCNNGKLSGSYTNKSCEVTQGASCSLGKTTIKSGETITAYKDATVLLGYKTGCSSETRSCENGTLSGSFVNQSCDVVYYNTDGPYVSGAGANCGNYRGGQGGNPDCTCGTSKMTSRETCNFNSFASGGNNNLDCVYRCVLQPQKANSVQIANCTLSTDGTIACTP